jgi:hypothetical protein
MRRPVFKKEAIKTICRGVVVFGMRHYRDKRLSMFRVTFHYIHDFNQMLNWIYKLTLMG